MQSAVQCQMWTLGIQRSNVRTSRTPHRYKTGIPICRKHHWHSSPPMWPPRNYWKILLNCQHVLLLFERLLLCLLSCLITYAFSTRTLSPANWTRLTSLHCPQIYLETNLYRYPQTLCILIPIHHTTWRRTRTSSNGKGKSYTINYSITDHFKTGSALS